jgi:hypothetical protein
VSWRRGEPARPEGPGAAPARGQAPAKSGRDPRGRPARAVYACRCAVPSTGDLRQSGGCRAWGDRRARRAWPAVELRPAHLPADTVLAIRRPSVSGRHRVARAGGFAAVHVRQTCCGLTQLLAPEAAASEVSCWVAPSRDHSPSMLAPRPSAITHVSRSATDGETGSSERRARVGHGQHSGAFRAGVRACVLGAAALVLLVLVQPALAMGGDSSYSLAAQRQATLLPSPRPSPMSVVIWPSGSMCATAIRTSTATIAQARLPSRSARTPPSRTNRLCGATPWEPAPSSGVTSATRQVRAATFTDTTLQPAVSLRSAGHPATRALPRSTTTWSCGAMVARAPRFRCAAMTSRCNRSSQSRSGRVTRASPQFRVSRSSGHASRQGCPRTSQAPS